MATRREFVSYHPLPAPGVVNNLKDEIQSKFMETVGSAINSFDRKLLPQQLEGALGTAGNIINSFEPKWTGQKVFDLDGEADFPDGYECPDEYWGSAPVKAQKPVSVKNLLGGIIAMIGRGCKTSGVEQTKDSKTSVSFLGSSDDGKAFLHSSVCMPSALHHYLMKKS
uniref:Uncharacterized protein n=1 Tax=Arundo donax TaxID=35708 RepID=A0A0A8ZKX0_ARUDO